MVDLNALANELKALGLVVEVGPDSIDVDKPWIVVFKDGEVQPGFSRIAPGDTVPWDVLDIIRKHVQPNL